MQSTPFNWRRYWLRYLVDFLGGADGHRRVGIEARKQPRGWPVELPVGAQFGQEAGGEQRVAVAAPKRNPSDPQTSLDSAHIGSK